MNRRVRRAAALLLAAVMVICLAACGETPANNANNTSVPDNTNTQTENTANTNTQTENTANTNTQTEDPGNTNTQTEDPGNTSTQDPDPGKEDTSNYTLVSSVAELIDAIEPGARIKLKSGVYDIGAALDEIARDGADAWNGSPYVSISQEYDGKELAVMDAEDLVIIGETDDFSDTQLLTSPRYACVLVLDGCTNVTLKNITLGHSEGGECNGDVLKIITSSDTVLENMDLFGCGVNAIHMQGHCNGLKVSDSVLRDCSGGTIVVDEDADAGLVEFSSCTMTGSYTGGQLPVSLYGEYYFRNCVFGTGESATFAFLDNIITTDCQFTEIESYPEYGPSSPIFSPYDFEEIAVPQNVIISEDLYLAYVMMPEDYDPNDAEWKPYTDPATGNALRFGVYFVEDRTGTFLWRDKASVEFTWDENSDGSLSYEGSDGSSGSITAYLLDLEDMGAKQTWMRLVREGNAYWFMIDFESDYLW